MTPREGSTTTLSNEHKEALAVGRTQGRAVRRYLEALETNRPKRGRKRTPDSIKKRLERIDVELADADPLQRLHLVQERLDLQSELVALNGHDDMRQIEEEFVDAAGPYSQRKGISYQAWRELGVPAPVLRKAAVGR